jgi:dihydroorotate dehydrogenase (NAD+) catalytic subunit
MLFCGRRMTYQRYRVAHVEDLNDTLRVLRLAEPLAHEPGQFVFLFLPGVGEKPFSLAASDPAAVVVRKRGVFSQALFDLELGDELFVRGPYGEAAPRCDTDRACVVAAGTGVAVAPALVAKLRVAGREVHAYLGVAAGSETGLAQLIPGAVTTVPDDGKLGRVLDEVRRREEPEAGRTTFYNIGPEGFMRAAASAQAGMSAAAPRIHLCLEPLMRCGVGICGSCEVGGRLLCNEGTFVRWADFSRAG